MLITVNNCGDAFKAKYNGIPYEFQAGRSITIPLDAAHHIFGFGLPDKSEVLSMHGWLRHNGEMDAAMARLDNFSFSIPNEIPNNIPDNLPEKLKQDIAALKNNIKSPAETVPGHNPVLKPSDKKSPSANNSKTISPTKIFESVVGGLVLVCVLYLIATYLGLKLN